MTVIQSKTHWELCRQGLPLAADAAAARWNEGQAFEIDRRVRLSREVIEMLKLSNWEATHHAEAA